jgi:flagellar basal-body rod modification protein FlgD
MTISSNASTAATSATVAAGSTATTGSATSAANAIGSQSAFLQLLVTQMQNQDPLNPMDNAQITSQLAQISTVDGITNLNTSIQQLISNSNTSQTIAAAGMLGTTVLVPGSTMTLNSGQAVYGINLPQAAGTVQVSITDASGNVLQTINLGAEPAGVTALTWNGAEASGATAAAGTYSFSVTAAQGSTAIAATALTGAVVQGVTQGTNGPQLNLGSLGTVPVSNVQQIL